MTDKEALEYIKNHGVWQFAAIHGWTEPDEKLIESFSTVEKELDEVDSLKNMLHNINLFETLQPDVDDFKKLELLEQLETLKNYYPPFKLFLKDMFEKGYNKDLNKIKEWLEDDD